MSDSWQPEQADEQGDEAQETTWSDPPRDAALPTLPALPPIRSTQIVVREGDASQGVRRDVLSAMHHAPSAIAPRHPHSSAAPGPTIITGDGRVPSLHPTMAQEGPRSRAMRISVSSIIMVVTLISLISITPLTAGATGRLGNYLSNGQLFALPTATPTPTPTPQPSTNGQPTTWNDPGASAVIAEINSVFGSYSAGAQNVAHCESGFDPNAWNGISILGSHAAGVFQILYPSTWDGTSYASQSPFNPDANIHAAYQIFSRDGDSWREWQCQP